jgi:hypothetical protein
MGSKFCAVLLLVMLSFSSKADVVNPGHINKQFVITNLDKFPAFTYSFLHQGYHYMAGYKRNPVDTVAVEINKRYKVSERGDDKSSLLAMDKNGKYFISDLKLGGAAIVGPSVKGIIEVYTITDIKNDSIKLKKQKEIVQYANGEEKERKDSSGLLAFSGTDGFASGLAIVSAGALLALLFLFILKKRKAKYIQLTA